MQTQLFLTDQECYKHVKNANVSYTLLVKSGVMGTESTTQGITFSSSLLTSDENSSQM